MKKSTLVKVCMFALLIIVAGALYAQAPPPPPPSGQGTDQPAPVGSGLAILAALGIAYGVAKWHKARKGRKRGAGNG